MSWTRTAAVVFDMDGLLIDSERLNFAASRHAAAELGHSLDDELYSRLIGKTEADVTDLLRAELGAGFPMPRFATLLSAEWRRLIASSGMPLMAGADELTRLLAKRGIPMAVATSTYRAAAERSLTLAGLDGRFDVMVTGDEVERGKPAPDIYLEAAARLGVAPERCAAFEDSNPGLLAAADAGMAAVLVPDMQPPSDEARRRATAVLESLEDAVAHLAAMNG